MPRETEANSHGNHCLDYITSHFDNRPTPTGIDSTEYRPSDVIITTFPKSGTTLTQFLCYQIVAMSGGGPEFDRTGLDFPDLSVVSPWIDYIPEVGIPPCESSPRILKTHSPVTRFDKYVGKHIVVVRDPVAFPASWLDFMFEAIVPNASTIPDDMREATFHACVEKHLLETPTDDDAQGNDEYAGLGRWHAFMKKSVFPYRDDVLVVFYEDIVSNMHAAVRELASFMNCKLTPDAVNEIVRRSDRNTMANDPRFYCRIESKRFGISTDLPKARQLSLKGFKRFKVRHDDLLRIEDMNQKAFGVRTYAEFRHMIRKQQESSFKY